MKIEKIFPKVIHKYQKPLNFEENNPDFQIFNNLKEEECQIRELKIFKKIRISNNSVAFRYFEIVPETCITEYNFRKYSKGFKFYLKFLFPKLNFTKKRFILITDEHTSNYYHWHAFALKKLAILKSQNLIEDSILFLPKKYKKYSFTFFSLEKFGIKKEQLFFLRRKSHVKVEELLVVDVSQQYPQYFQEVKKVLLSKISQEDYGFGNKIYISRSRQALRFIENEEEVIEILTKYGFKKIIAEDYSYEQQVNIFSKANYLIGPHGAGLTNLLFMPGGSSILELSSTPERVSDFFALSSMTDIKYFFQKCEMGEKSKRKDFHHATLIVDVKKLERNIKAMLAG